MKIVKQEHSWNSTKWKEDFKDIYKFHLMRQKVFFHTVDLVRTGYYITENGHKIDFCDSTSMMNDTKVYSQKLDVLVQVRTEETKILVENKDSLVSAEEWKNRGYNVAVLNMANRQNPGGGVHNGAGAQEENLFRRTNLFMSMFQFAPYANKYEIKKRNEQYPLDRNYGGVYTPNATVFRGTEKDGYPLLEQPYQMSFISVPGMNRPKLDNNGMIEDKLVEGVKNKIRTILNIGLLNNHDCLILGALGCGAFKNPPKHIAKLFHEIIDEEFKNAFKVIVFAILDDHNSMKEHNKEGNFKPFYDEFH